jgi:hypothetical protein
MKACFSNLKLRQFDSIECGIAAYVTLTLKL